MKTARRPERYRNAIVPHIYVEGASNAIRFYERAFGAVELFRLARPDGSILHAELSINGSVIMIGDPDDERRPPRRGHAARTRTICRETGSSRADAPDRAAGPAAFRPAAGGGHPEKTRGYVAA
jgi:uncharacterized glyoxalase superfamily protein PhnB